MTDHLVEAGPESQVDTVTRNAAVLRAVLAILDCFDHVLQDGLGKANQVSRFVKTVGYVESLHGSHGIQCFLPRAHL